MEWWPCRGAHSHYSPTRPGRYMCYAWGEGGSAARAPFFPHFFIFHFSFSSTSHKRNETKNTRTSMAAAVTSLPRVCFFIFHYESGLVLKIVFEKKQFGAHFFHFFHFSFSSTSHKRNGTKNTRTSMAAAATSLPRVCFHLLFVWKCHLSYFCFSKLLLHARTTHVLSFLHVQRPGPLLAVHPPQNHARAAQAHLVPLFCRSLTPSSISSFLSCA